MAKPMYPSTGAAVYVLGTAVQLGGTSLAAPLWSGMAANLNRYLAANGRAPMGFAAPRLYQLATNATTYGSASIWASERSSTPSIFQTSTSMPNCWIASIVWRIASGRSSAS